MAIVELRNDFLTALISTYGAELQSLKTNADKVEFVWEGDPNYWKRHAPVLFPIVGKLKNDTYRYQDEEFHLGQHGFARDHEFNVVQQDRNNIVLLLEGSRETLSIYPFNFRLSIQYELIGQSLKTSYKVVNSDRNDMYFSIGAHPAFKCPLNNSEIFDNYFLRFNKDSYLERYLLKNGLMTNESETVELENNRLKLGYKLFERDAIVLKGLKSNSIYLQTREKDILGFHFNDFPYFGIWTPKPGAPFICLEPWFGVADYDFHDQDFAKKEGIIGLKPADEFSCNYTIEILND